MSAFTSGLRLHDRYLLEERIGTGGMASVWRATDLVLGRGVAIKEGARQEAQAAARLTHPHITGVHDYAEIILNGHVVPYLVLELLTGQTLAERMRQGPIPWDQGQTIARQVASALAFAHQHGVVHQDIKPANIMLTPSGVKVLDFGIASWHGREIDPEWISGTPAYAPPERLRGGTAQPSADVFSWGVVAYEMATGHLPWPIETWRQAASIERTPPDPLPAGVGGTAPEILAALALDPAARPSAASLATSLATSSAATSSAALTAAATSSAATSSAATSSAATAMLPKTAATPKPTLIARAGPGPIAGSARVPTHPTRTYATNPPPPPRQRRGSSPGIAAALALIVLLITLGAVFLAAALMQHQGTSKSLRPTAPTSRPAPTTAAPTPNADSVNELLSAVRDAVFLSVQTGQIDDNVGEDLQQRLDDIGERWRRNRVNDFQNKVEDLRRRIQERADHGEISRPVAATLDVLLQQLAAQVR